MFTFLYGLQALFGKETLYQGRLACAVEGGGKRRFFIIGNYVKQRLLKPYHDWAMSVYTDSRVMVHTIKRVLYTD